MSARVAAMWKPADTGAFWTERHAGFALLAHVWARIVTDDQGAILEGRANTAFDAYMTMQAPFPQAWTDPAARCFAYTADSAGESFGTTGWSPWMSAIVADALDQRGANERGVPLGDVAGFASVTGQGVRGEVDLRVHRQRRRHPDRGRSALPVHRLAAVTDERGARDQPVLGLGDREGPAAARADVLATGSPKTTEAHRVRVRFGAMFTQRGEPRGD